MTAKAVADVETKEAPENGYFFGASKSITLIVSWMPVIDAVEASARHNRANLAAHALVSGRAQWCAAKECQRVGTLMTTIQAVMLGVMLALTPSLVLLAFLVWREGIGVIDEDSDRETRWSRR